MLRVNSRPVYAEKDGLIHAVDGAYMHNHRDPTTWTACGYDTENCFTDKQWSEKHIETKITCAACREAIKGETKNG